MQKRPSRAAAKEAAERVDALKALSPDDDTAEIPADSRPAEPGSIGYQLLGPGAIETPVRPARPARSSSDAEPVVELVKKTSNGRSERDQKYADLIKIVHAAETLRFDVQTTVHLETELDAASDLLARARAQEANREIVDPAIHRGLQDCFRRAGNQLESWMLQRGIKTEGGGS